MKPSTPDARAARHLNASGMRTFPMIRGAAAAGLTRLLGRDSTEEVLRKLGLPLKMVEDRHQEIPLSLFLELLNHVVEVTGNDALGLQLGVRSTLDQLGLLGYIMRNSTTLVAALRRLERFYNFHQQGARIFLKTEPEHILLGYGIVASNTPNHRQDVEMTIASCFAFVNQLVDDSVYPKQVWFEHAEPESSTAQHRLFRCPVLFNQPLNALLYRHDTFLRPVPGADQRLLLILEDYMGRILTELPDDRDLPGIVEYHVSNMLRGGSPDMASVARLLGMSQRTLCRRLEEYNFSFRDIVANTRMRIAMEYLRESKLPITEIALLLGYSGPSSFIHAFQRWTGDTPNAYRK
ncbi:MAG: AraC family transcriptional regulator [Desulfovibrio sp.]|uniref:AraC family transcriptional regulator n=1 Tax=Desulfovibrio sp. 7SRBS1 TaxID=3378064 RepID=UPI003B3F5946